MEQEVGTILNEEKKSKILLLDKKKDAILLSKEKEYRLKSKSPLGPSSYENTKFFHHFTNGRK
jgi:hypothetical protein